MKRMILIGSVLLLFSQVMLFPQNEKQDNQKSDTGRQNEKMSSSSQDFISMAVSGGKMEVELGQIAMEKAGSQEVKQFGQKMVTDHSKANEELMLIISQNNLKKPQEDLMTEHKKKVTDLSNRYGTDFDKEYMKSMVEDHQKDIEEFEKASRSNENEAVRQWAEKTLPTLKQHLELALQISKMLKTADKDYR